MAAETLSLSLPEATAKRRCRKCWVVKPLDEFERRGAGQRRGRICKECRNATRDPAENRRRAKEWAKANPEKHNAQTRRNHEARRTDVARWIASNLRSTRARCKVKGIECSVSAEQIVQLFTEQEGLCALTGRQMVYGSRGQQRDSLSIDRIVPALGYVAGNVRLVTYQANMARGALDDDELIAFCEAVLASRGKRAGTSAACA
jgi:hypothetical protein